MKTLAVVGLGYVGLPLALLADEKGYEVIGVDIDAEKIEKIIARISPIKDKAIQQQLKKANIYATTDFSKLVKAQIIVVCVPTPVKDNKKPNYDYVTAAANQIASFLQKGQLIVIESTVNPGTIHEMVIPELERQSQLVAGKDFFIAHVPERINPGDNYWSVSNIPRVVGADDDRSMLLATRFYSSILDAALYPLSSIKEAEAVKIVENAFRDINIAFVNELAQCFDLLDINIVHVLDAAATKPFAFMKHTPGCGVGGHCIPVDPYFLIDYARRHGFEHTLISEARKVNEAMPKYTLKKLESLLIKKGKRIENSTIAILGLSYKPSIEDMRESPSLDLVKELTSLRATVRKHDPYHTKQSIQDVILNTDAVIIATAHAEYLKLTPDDFLKGNVDVIVDGRNCLNYELFEKSPILYCGIGL